MSSGLHVYIVSRENSLLFDCSLNPTTQAADFQNDAFFQISILSALDQLDAKLPSSTALYLKQVDKCNAEWAISAYVTAGYSKFLLVHPTKTDDTTIKNFFIDLHENYVKAILSPFSDITLDPNGFLEQSIHLAAKKLLKYVQ